MTTWVLFGYLIGSVPFAFLLARRAGIDVRVSGSGNVGAANVLRTSGAALGVTVMALDISKGAAAVLVTQATSGVVAAMASAGAAAVVGHIYPIWLRFHGGKGVAVAAGVFSVLAPFATLASLAVFVTTIWLTRIVSFGSIAATIALPPIAWWSGARPEVTVAAVGSSALILFRHRSNIGRLVARSERRIGERVG
jgi:glycerol-3-phosphate acyltransferase PlsY